MEGSRRAKSAARLERDRLEEESYPGESQSLVFYADDQYFCSQSFGIHFSMFSPKNMKVESFYNGKDVVQRTQQVLDKIDP